MLRMIKPIFANMILKIFISFVKLFVFNAAAVKLRYIANVYEYISSDLLKVNLQSILHSNNLGKYGAILTHLCSVLI